MEKNLNGLLRKYRYNSPMCEYCGGRVIRDKEWVCSVCGMVQDKIHVPGGKSPNSNTTESKIRKYRRESDHSKRLHKGDLKRNKFATVEISREVKNLLTEYLKSKPIYQYLFLDEIILKAILDENEKE